MKITYYSKYSNLGPSSRYRAYQYADQFRAGGFDFQISELFDDAYFNILRTSEPLRTFQKVPYALSRFHHRKKALKMDRSDLSVIEQQLFPYIPFSIEKNYLPSRYLFEFDDAIYLTHPAKIPKVIQNASGVIAGNETLAGFANRFNRNVHVIPTALNTDVFKPAQKSPREKVILGWSGLEYNFLYLEMLTPVLQKLIQNLPVEIRILSGSKPRGFDFPFRFEMWDPVSEVEQLNEFDIGLMPLKMDQWCKGKCGFKLLQYMSLEIPSVATPIGVNERIIQNGVNGFLAEALSEWESRLCELITNLELRQRLGKAARSTVLAGYSTSVWFPKLAALYRSYLDS